MHFHNDLTILSFEDKIKLLDEAEKSCAGKLIEQLLANRHMNKQTGLPSGEKKILHKTKHVKE